MKRSLTGGLGIGLLVAGLVAPAASASGTSSGCSVPVHGTTGAAIRDAIDKTTPTCPGVQLAALHYKLAGTLYINKPGVILVGVPGTVLDETKATAHITLDVSAPGVEVHGVTIPNSPGIAIQVGGDSANVTIAGNTLYGSGQLGVHVLGVKNVSVSDNIIHHNGNNGIDVHNSLYVTVTGNSTYHNGGPRLPNELEGNGILVFCDQHVKVSRNVVYDNSQGQPGKRDGIRISDGQLANQTGSCARPTVDVSVTDNTINDAFGNQAYAVALRSSTPDMTAIVVTGNHGAGSRNPGVYAGGCAPGGCIVQNNDLR